MLDRQSEPIGVDGEDDGIALASKVDFLSRPDSYIPAPTTVTARETHMSWVFMAGDRVYKLKKPVRFPYLDFSTLERRADACRAEMSLNRRLAPDVYLGVAPLTMTPAGYAIGGGGRIADWLVVMRRLDETQTLEARLKTCTVSRVDVERLASNLHQFYTHAPRVVVNPANYQVSLQKAALVDRQVLLNPAFELNRGTIEHIFNVQRRFVQQNRKILAARIHRRFILDSHGDLRPEHIWLSAPFPIIDCLEFNSRLRTLDALDEVAFLHLECERLGGRWVGKALRRRLAVFLGDEPASGLFLFYRVNRALLRTRLSIAHLIDLHPRTPARRELSLDRTSGCQPARTVATSSGLIQQEIGERLVVVQPANRLREQRRRRNDFELGKHRPMRKPEGWHTVGRDDAIDRKIRKRAFGAGHEETVGTQAMTPFAPWARAAFAARTRVPPVLTRLSMTTQSAFATSPANRSPDTTPELRCFSTNALPIGRPAAFSNTSRKRSALLPPPRSGDTTQIGRSSAMLLILSISSGAVLSATDGHRNAFSNAASLWTWSVTTASTPAASNIAAR